MRFKAEKGVSQLDKMREGKESVDKIKLYEKKHDKEASSYCYSPLDNINKRIQITRDQLKQDAYL